MVKGWSSPKWILLKSIECGTTSIGIWCDPSTGGECTGVWRSHKPSECKGYSILKTENKMKRDMERGGTN